MHTLTTLAALAALALLATPASGQDELTHLGVKSSRIVNLVWSFDNATICPDNNQGLRSFFRLKATGERETAPFVVPSGKRLIITDVSWVASPRPNSQFHAGRLLRIYLNTRHPGGAAGGEFYISDGLHVTTTTSALLGGSDHFNSGIAIAPGRVICARASTIHSGGSSTHFPQEVRISGYLSKF